MKTSTHIIKLYFARIKSCIMFLSLTSLFLFVGCEQKSSVPDLGLMPDFGSIKDTKEKKKQFFGFLRPMIKAENDKVIAQRNRLLDLQEKHRTDTKLSKKDRDYLNKLLAEYNLDGLDLESEDNWRTLIERVDIVPLDLALIQAAKESGWGTSRFARQGNNLFGQRCFTKGCGIVPNDRSSGEKHEVKRFDSIEASVRSYVYNLNTNQAYSKFRKLRFDQRQKSEYPDGCSLVAGLPKYSERGNDYLEEVRAMIRANRLYMVYNNDYTTDL